MYMSCKCSHVQQSCQHGIDVSHHRQGMLLVVTVDAYGQREEKSSTSLVVSDVECPGKDLLCARDLLVAHVSLGFQRMSSLVPWSHQSQSSHPRHREDKLTLSTLKASDNKILS